MIFHETPRHTGLDLSQSIQRQQLPQSIGSKRLTFSFDDGVRQDVRVLEILNRYRLKATFNLNSALLGKDMTVNAYGKTVPFQHFTADEIPVVYCGHEVAAHTRTHRDLTKLSEHEIISEIEGDRLTLSEVCEYPVIGMAYPGEGCNHDNRVLSLIRAKSKIQYARTVQCSGGFADPTDFLQVNPTARRQIFLSSMFLQISFCRFQRHNQPCFISGDTALISTFLIAGKHLRHSAKKFPNASISHIAQTGKRCFPANRQKGSIHERLFFN